MRRFFLFLSRLIVALGTTWPVPVMTADIDLTPFQDSVMPLANPHKGWYHHFPDNHVNKYIIAKDADLLDFPGMDHLYMRLAWAYLEPKEGEFNWSVIDPIIKKWTDLGLGIAFRISCRETGTDRIEQQFATPQWVAAAGAKGDFYYKGERTGPTGPWEPVFDDPVFLEKLERFLSVFAARYDGKPWLRYVDIGSIGDWGEGHTHSGSRLTYGFEQRKIHVDLYRQYFRKTQLIISDDFVYSIPGPAERQRMHRYVVDSGIGYRDDSILVDYYVRAYAATDTVRSPEFFADVWKERLTVLELEHYRSVKRLGNWTPTQDSNLGRYGDGRSGADFFRGALKRLHASYIGYHGLADQWLSDNPRLTEELLNRCGYWYFLNRVSLPPSFQAGATHNVRMDWQNRGVAPAYHDYDLLLRFEGERTIDLTLDSGNRQWIPDPRDRSWSVDYSVRLPDAMPTGRYDLKAKLFSRDANRDVFIAMDSKRRDSAGFYHLADVMVTKR